jgi:hypothetical protein
VNNSQEQAASTLPDPQTAYNNLFAGIHQRVFFQKCAAAGYQPNDQRQAQWMLETAGKLRTVAQAQGQQKQSVDENDPYYNANRALDGVLAQYGLDGGVRQQQAQEEALAIKQAASEWAGDPTFYNSVLALKSAEAAQIQAEIENWRRQQAG